MAAEVLLTFRFFFQRSRLGRHKQEIRANSKRHKHRKHGIYGFHCENIPGKINVTLLLQTLCLVFKVSPADY